MAYWVLAFKGQGRNFEDARAQEKDKKSARARALYNSQCRKKTNRRLLRRLHWTERGYLQKRLQRADLVRKIRLQEMGWHSCYGKIKSSQKLDTKFKSQLL